MLHHEDPQFYHRPIIHLPTQNRRISETKRLCCSTFTAHAFYKLVYSVLGATTSCRITLASTKQSDDNTQNCISRFERTNILKGKLKPVLSPGFSRIPKLITLLLERPQTLRLNSLTFLCSTRTQNRDRHRRASAPAAFRVGRGGSGCASPSPGNFPRFRQMHSPCIFSGASATRDPTRFFDNFGYDIYTVHLVWSVKNPGPMLSAKLLYGKVAFLEPEQPGSLGQREHS
jgi:hypothetical protein